MEPTLYRLYRWIQVDRLIDGYFIWPAVMWVLKNKGVSERKFIEAENAVNTDMFRPLTSVQKESAGFQIVFIDQDGETSFLTEENKCPKTGWYATLLKAVKN